MSNNALCISRLDNGQIMASFSRMQGENPGVLGNFYGDASVVFGSTDNGADSEYLVFGNQGSYLEMTNSEVATSFWGQGLGVDVLDNNHESNIQWNVSYGALSFADTDKATNLEVTQLAHDNLFTYGWGDAQIMDSGSYNMHILGSGTTYYASTASSVGACVQGGAGNAAYQIAGNYGVFKQGSGYSTYQINSDATEYNPGTYGFKNTIISDAPSAIKDLGSRSYIWQRGAGSTLDEQGVYSIAEVSDDNPVKLGFNGIMSAVFSGGKTSEKIELNDNSGKKYTINLDQLLYDAGWISEFGNSEDFYMGDTASGHANHLTGQWLKSGAVATLFGRLTLGDAYGRTVA